MRRLTLISIFVLIAVQLEAQVATPSPSAIIQQFKTWYLQNKTDSIYSLYSSPMKAAISLAGNQQLVSTLKAQLGDITGAVDEGPGAGEMHIYRLVFSKPLQDLQLVVAQGKIAGLHPLAHEDSKAGASGAAASGPAGPSGSPNAAGGAASNGKALANGSTSSTQESMKSPDNISIKTDSGSIYGTLLLSSKTGKVPVVLILAGSGPTDRNGNDLMLKLHTNAYLLLAEGLAAKGIATVRYDKRGIGRSMPASGQNEQRLNYKTYIRDARQFIHLLKSDSRFSSVTVLGHSEGSIIGMVSAADESADAFISVCGSATDIVQAMHRQLKAKLPAADTTAMNTIISSLKSGKAYPGEVPASLQLYFRPSVQPYLISAMSYDPETEIAKLKVPVLIIGGSSDIQVRLEDAKLLSNAIPRASLVEIAGMNHILKSSPADPAKNVLTYSNPALPLHKKLVPVILRFMKAAGLVE